MCGADAPHIFSQLLHGAGHLPLTGAHGLQRPLQQHIQLPAQTLRAGYKTPWIAKKTLEDGSVPVLPYTRYTGRQDRYKPWEYTYDPANDTYTCPRGGILRHTTTDRDGKRTYRSTPEQCRS